MTLSLTHTFVSAIPDGADATVVRPSNWNDTHTVAGTLPIANGGTNTASVPGNGQLLIGNGTDYTVANLTAGTGVTITNTAGGISIAAPDNGTVTAVTASSPIASSGGTAPNISLTGTIDVPHGGTGATTLTGYVIGNGASAMTASATIPTSNLTGTLPVANGGTGQTTYTDGQLLIGNTTGNTLAKATLTAGTGVTITNGAGTITISAPDTGTVTSVTASSPLASSGGATPNLSLTGTVAVANGGTAGTATPTAGAIAYGTGTAYAFSAAGTSGQILLSGATGSPTWATLSSSAVTSFNAGTTGLTPSSATTGAVTLAGTLAIANGGTNSTATATAGGAGYGTGTAHAYTAAGTLGQVLTSAGAGTPTWTTLTTGVSSVSNSDGTLTVSPTTGAVVASLALGHANSWSGVQTFTTPVLGAATGTSLALGGATIGTNALAVTGTSTFSSTVTHSSATTLSGALTYGGVTLSNAVTGTGNMVLSASPTLTGTLTAATASLSALSVTGALASFLGPSSGTGYSAQFYNNAVSGSVDIYIEQSNGTSSGTSGTMRVSKAAGNNRSINATGTINASGADYAEYMVKAKSCGVIAKGDIAGVDVDGNLTDKYANAHSFVVKSTNPSYVGGDSWSDGNPAVGPRPEPTSTKDEADLVKWKERHEAARAMVDRIAFSGQVPVNVSGATVGDYIVPLAGPDGGITGQAVTNPTFDQYRAAVGRVWKILEDGRAFVSVKVS